MKTTKTFATWEEACRFCHMQDISNEDITHDPATGQHFVEITAPTPSETEYDRLLRKDRLAADADRALAMLVKSMGV